MKAGCRREEHNKEGGRERVDAWKGFHEKDGGYSKKRGKKGCKCSGSRKKFKDIRELQMTSRPATIKGEISKNCKGCRTGKTATWETSQIGIGKI